MNFTKLIFSISLCFIVAFLGSVVTLLSISTWYAQLNKPFFSPPNSVFGPVWTILYLLMGMSLYLILNSGNKKRNNAIKIFLVQLGLNFIWSLVFFGFHLPLLALVTIVFLWIAIFMTIKSFSKISRLAATLLIPYLLWVSFAALLNLLIVILN